MWSILFACSRQSDPAQPPSPPPPAPQSAQTALTFDGPVPRNLVIISLDTTRRDRVGHHSGLPTTPFLDARASEGVVLADHRSCSNWTAPSMLCATTGYSPHELGFWPGTGDDLVEGVPVQGLPTLAAALASEGYGTALVTTNPVFSRDYDTAQGFDKVILRDFEGASEVHDPALARADELLLSGAPFYLHLHYFDPHREYCPPEAYRAGLAALPEVGFDVCDELIDALDVLGEHDASWQQALLDRVRVLYDGELRYFDDELARLWDALDARGALDDTLVVWMTDHGEQHLERGKIDHGFDLFAEENRASAMFWAKNLAPATFSGPTLHQDIAATLFALYGIPQPEGASGIPLGGADDTRVRRLFAYSLPDHGLPQLAVVSRSRAMHYDWEGARSLYHTDTDPAESTSVYQPGDPDVMSLWNEMRPFVDEIAARWPHLPPPVQDGP